MSDKISILITALGGEGGGTLMNWILECARKKKLHVQGTSVPGVAQRTGRTMETGSRRPLVERDEQWIN